MALAASRVLSIAGVLFSKRMRLCGMGNVKAFRMTAIARHPGHDTATFIVPERQGPLFAGVALRKTLSFGSVEPFRWAPFFLRCRSLPSSQPGAQWERALRRPFTV